MPKTPVTQLLQRTAEDYGEPFKAHLFEQYKLYVESAEKVGARRESANNYLLTVNASLVALFGLLAGSSHKGGWGVLVPIAGILISVTWYRIIASYRDLNTVKFKVIHELEHQLPAGLYAYEWHKAQEGQGKAYHPLTHLERWVPVVFIILYIALGVIGGLDLLK